MAEKKSPGLAPGPTTTLDEASAALPTRPRVIET